jgi:hypothetical protein
MYLGLFVFTGITFGDADADADFDADVDAEVDGGFDHDAEMDHDAEVSAEHDFEHDAESSHAVIAAHPVHTIALDNPEPHVSPLFSFLSFLGLGKIPLSLALMIFMLIWGVAGFAFNALLRQWLGVTDFIGVISVPITLLATLAFTGAAAALFAKAVPVDDGPSHRRSDLVGRPGEAIYDIDADFGMADVRGDAGDLFQIPCRTASGSARIPKGARIVVFDYDREKGVFHVAPFDA